MDESEALRALAALSQERRLDMFRLLVRHMPDGLPAGEIARATGAVQNTASSHLAILEQAGLVTATREGRVIRYAAELSAARRLIGFLLEDCCGGHPEVCAPLLRKLECQD